MKRRSSLANKPVTVDMSGAKSFEPVPDRTKCLVAVSKWEVGTSQSGNPKLHVELTVLEPEKYASRKFFDDINLDNDNTKGRLMDLLLALGYEEKKVRVANFALPEEDAVEGQQLCVTSRIVKAKEGSEFGDKSVASKPRAAEFYKGEGA